MKKSEKLKQLHESSGKHAVIFPNWDAPEKIVALTTTRYPGVSKNDFAAFNLAMHVGDAAEDVDQNRGTLQTMLEDSVNFQWLEQVHSTRVVQAQSGLNPAVADAVYTRKPAIACCILTADCLPILLTTRAGKAVAAIHAGWRGLSQGIIKQTLREFTAETNSVIAWLGPAIGPCHFEVGEEVLEAFIKQDTQQLRSELEQCFQPTGSQGKYLGDLYKIARLKLMSHGVEEVSGGEYCTYCQEQDFYSFRRQKRTGRMVSLIYIKP